MNDYKMCLIEAIPTGVYNLMLVLYGNKTLVWNMWSNVRMNRHHIHLPYRVHKAYRESMRFTRRTWYRMENAHSICRFSLNRPMWMKHLHTHKHSPLSLTSTHTHTHALAFDMQTNIEGICIYI